MYETCYSLTKSGNINTLVGFHCPVCQKISSFCHDVCPGTTFAIAICIMSPFQIIICQWLLDIPWLVFGFFPAFLGFDVLFEALTHPFGVLIRSFLCGGSTGIFIYAYCLYYYHARSDMSGFMQTSFFFGYMACICYGFFLMLGTIGFRASLFFVRHIYRSIKCE